MKIYLGVDYRGQEQKAQLHEALSRHGDTVDVVADDPSLDSYVAISRRVAEKVLDNDGSTGVLMCGTGGGSSIVANKHRGIYAVRCYVPEDAEDAKLINNANVLCLSGRVPVEQNEKIIDTFMTTQYQGRKPERLEAIKQLEEDNLK